MIKLGLDEIISQLEEAVKCAMQKSNDYYDQDLYVVSDDIEDFGKNIADIVIELKKTKDNFWKLL